MLSIKEALHRSEELAGDTARLDTEILLAFAMGKPRTFLYTWPDQQLSLAQQQQFDDFLQRRLAGEPVAYITGRRGFWTFDLQVNPHVLIPRPETELLVELALNYLGDKALIADLGTGSGAVALALAAERPHSRVIAVDRSEQALALARANALELHLDNVEFRSGSWCAALPQEKFDMIVSNPPYIDASDPHLDQGDLRFEPVSALIAAQEGLADIMMICQQARDYLCSAGLLFLEHGYNQGAAVRGILQQYDYGGIKTCQDLAGHERVTLACLMPDEGMDKGQRRHHAR